MLDNNLDFTGLQETLESNFTKNEHSLGGGRNFGWHLAPPRGRSNGILVGINKNLFDLMQVENGKYFVRILIFENFAEFDYNLTSVYGDAKLEGKSTFLAELSRGYHDNSMSCLVGGGLNIIRKSYEETSSMNLIIGVLFLLLLLNMLGREKCPKWKEFYMGKLLVWPYF